MTPQELKNSILQLAIQGKLVEQRPEEGTRTGTLRADSGGEAAADQSREDQKGKAPAGDRGGRKAVRYPGKRGCG